MWGNILFSKEITRPSFLEEDSMKRAKMEYNGDARNLKAYVHSVGLCSDQTTNPFHKPPKFMVDISVYIKKIIRRMPFMEQTTLLWLL